MNRMKFAPGQSMDISGKFYNTNTSTIPKFIVIKVNQTEDKKTLQSINVPIKNNNFSYSIIKEDIGKYNISVYLPNESRASYSVVVEVINPIFTTTSYLLILGSIFFIILIFMSSRAVKKERELTLNNQLTDVKLTDVKLTDVKLTDNQVKDVQVKDVQVKDVKFELDLLKYKIYRFAFISGIVFSIIGGLIFSEIEIGSNSPAGVVLKQVTDTNGNLVTDNNTGLPIKEWVINIGGNIVGKYSSFIVNIPFFVVMLGLIGGYLRYLSKAASKVYLEDTIKYFEENTSSDFAVVTQAELSEIALSPLLATVVWLLISQGQTTFSVYTLAAVSFSVGLVTREIMNAIKIFMNTINLSKQSKSS
jgi:hypothetical protein